MADALHNHNCNHKRADIVTFSVSTFMGIVYGVGALEWSVHFPPQESLQNR